MGSVARFLVHYVVGATVWAEYMPETFFGLTMTTPWFYSALYNGSFMLIDMVLVLVIGALLWKPLRKYTQYMTTAIFYRKTVKMQKRVGDTLGITQDIETRVIQYNHILRRNHIRLSF